MFTCIYLHNPPTPAPCPHTHPPFPQVMAGGQIVRSGGPELALELEAEGYAFLDGAN